MTLKRSLKVIKTGTIRKLGCGFLFTFHSNCGRILGAVSYSPSIVTMAVRVRVNPNPNPNYGCIFNRLWNIKRQSVARPWKLGCLRSLKVAPFDRPHTTFYWSAIVSIPLSGTVFELFDVEWCHDFEIWVRGHSRSFKPCGNELTSMRRVNLSFGLRSNLSLRLSFGLRAGKTNPTREMKHCVDWSVV